MLSCLGYNEDKSRNLSRITISSFMFVHCQIFFCFLFFVFNFSGGESSNADFLKVSV